MRIFLGFAFTSSILYVGIACGYLYGKKKTIENVVHLTCEKIEERKAYLMCAVTVRENLNAIETKTVSD